MPPDDLQDFESIVITDQNQLLELKDNQSVHTVELNLSNNAAVEYLSQALQILIDKSSLHTLTINYQAIKAEYILFSVVAIAGLLKGNKNIKALKIVGASDVPDPELILLLDSIMADSGVISFALNERLISTQLLNHIIFIINTNKTLRELDLSNCQATESPEDEVNLLTALCGNTTLSAVALPRTNFDVTEALIARLIRTHPELKKLHVGGDRAHADNRLIHILKALEHNQTLEFLDLSNISGCGNLNKYFSQLFFNNRLHTLILNGCLHMATLEQRILFFRNIAALLKHNSKIKRLELGNNLIGTFELDYIAEGLKENNSIVSLNLSGADEHLSMRSFYELLATNNTLVSLDLDLKSGYKEIPLLAKALTTNTALQRLRIHQGSENKIEVIDSIFTNVLKGNYALFDVVAEQPLPDLENGILKRNRALHTAFKPIRMFKQSMFVDHQTSLAAIQAIEKEVPNLSELPSGGFVLEHYRFLHALGHLSTGAELDAFEELTQPFQQPQLQGLAHLALGHLLMTSRGYNRGGKLSIEEQSIRYKGILLYLKDHLDSSMMLPYAALAFFQDKGKESLFTAHSELQKTSRVISYSTLIAILKMILHFHSEHDATCETQLFSKIVSYGHYNPLIINWLWKSPTFISTLRKYYPDAKPLIIVEECLVNEMFTLHRIDEMPTVMITTNDVKECEQQIFSSLSYSLSSILGQLENQIGSFLSSHKIADEIPITEYQENSTLFLDYLKTLPEFDSNPLLANLTYDYELLNVSISGEFLDRLYGSAVMAANTQFRGYPFLNELITKLNTLKMKKEAGRSNEWYLNLLRSYFPSYTTLAKALQLLTDDSQLLNLNYQAFSISDQSNLLQVLAELKSSLNSEGINKLDEYVCANHSKSESPAEETELFVQIKRISELKEILDKVESFEELFTINLKSYENVLDVFISYINVLEPIYPTSKNLFTLKILCLVAQISLEQKKHKEEGVISTDEFSDNDVGSEQSAFDNEEEFFDTDFEHSESDDEDSIASNPNRFFSDADDTLTNRELDFRALAKYLIVSLKEQDNFLASCLYSYLKSNLQGNNLVTITCQLRDENVELFNLLMQLLEHSTMRAMFYSFNEIISRDDISVAPH